MNDLISKAAAIDALWKVKDERDSVYYTSAIHTAVETIEQLPSAQPERKTGRWIVYKAPDQYHCGMVKCPFCGEDMVAESDEYNYCPNCGADMRGEWDE